jgi:hypothetical protein
MITFLGDSAILVTEKKVTILGTIIVTPGNDLISQKLYQTLIEYLEFQKKKDES